MTLVCNQLGGEPTGDLQTSTYYFVEKQMNEEWVTVEMLPSEYEIGWDAVAWIIPMDETIEWEVNWEWLYGELPDGKYRVGKEIMDFRGTRDYNTKIYYANFEVTN